MESQPPYTAVASYGFHEEKNPRYRPTMEDAHVFLNGFGEIPEQAFFGIYDGHGGREAVDFVATRLHDNFDRQLTANPSAPIPEVLTDVFEKTDNEMAKAGISFNGTTAATGFIRTETVDGQPRKVLYSANCGDARLILIKQNGAGVVRLSRDHKPSNPDEVERIRQAGGFVSSNRVNGILGVARALGDHAMKQFIISVPYISRTELTSDDTHIVVACDGIWDVLTDEKVAQLISQTPDDCSAAANLLVERALADGSMDNISVMVIKLLPIN